MADVDIRFSATIVDELSTEASTTAYATVPDSVTLAQLGASWTAWAQALDAVTDGAISHGRADILHTFVGADKGNGAGNPKTGSRVEQNAVINFANVVTDRRWGEAIPSFFNAGISNGKVNLANVAVQALITLMTGAVNGGHYTNNAYQNLLGLVDAILSFRKRRRQLARSSFER